MRNPKISVIIPSLNVKQYIRECIESVLNQTFKDIEIICVDSESTDGTADVLEEYSETDPRLSLIKSDKRSYGNQVNIGISKANGKYISIIETDDFIKKDMLEKLYESSEKASVDIVKGNFYHFDDTDNENPKVEVDKNKKFQNYQGKKFKIEEQPQFLNGHPSIWAGIYRKKFLQENNITFLEEPGGGWVDNIFFYQTAIKAKSIKYIDTPLYYYRTNNPNSSSNNISSYTMPMKRILNIFDMFDEYGYENRDVTVLFYDRLFRYIEIILENNEMDIKNLTGEEKEYIYKVLQKVDRKVVSREMILNFQKIYYKYRSPLFLKV